MTQATIRPSDVVQTVTEHPWRTIVPVAVVTLLALAYAVARPTSWEAAQALVVRDEVGDRLTRPGKFAHVDEMKTSQETILELAKSRGVLSKALAEIGPPTDRHASRPWPSEQDLEALQGNVKITPPKGAEFGKTEVFYLKVQDTNQHRAVELTLAICRQLQNRFAELREAKAHSTIDELTRSVTLAHDDLATATRALGDMEQRFGGDLSELRILNESPSGDSDLRRTAIELEKELRGYQATQTEGQELLKLLASAQGDPSKLLASPSVLLKSQPALGRLKDGLVDAQLRTGQALGTMSQDHPLVQAAHAAEQAIGEQLHDEIGVAIRGIEVDLRVNADRIRALEEQNSAIQGRLGRLATVRAEYANLVAATKYRGETLKAVERDLAEARSSQAAARAASLINLVDSPDAGSRPLGPGRTTIVLAGIGGGLLIALAIVFLTINPGTPHESQAARTLPMPSAQIAERATGLTLKQALQRVAARGI
jgi:succinoglycan biosynthesis transport protein ExoP